ncbi:MAG: alpha/beta hydrolase, partial [Ardenticatenales bacterium]|nr:alpha/beta hydrolase [Ardenticatenales bacterium]
MVKELYTEQWGEGESVVLLHGILEAFPGRVWQAQRDINAYHFIAPHRRNYGESPVMGRKSFEVDVQDTIMLLR